MIRSAFILGAKDESGLYDGLVIRYIATDQRSGFPSPTIYLTHSITYF